MKKLFLLLILVLSAATMLADDVTPEQALQTARQFARYEAAKQSQARRALATSNPQLAYSEKSKIVGKDNVYVINFGNDQGFVVVSGESGTSDEILGYCDHGAFEYEKAPVQLKGLLGYYTTAIDSLRKNPALAVSRRAAQSWPSYLGNVIVEPLLTTQWSQWAPYNNLCPPGCPSGCVPTAVAQIMRYWRWPDVTREKVYGEDFSGHTYDWDNMIDNYETTGYTAKQAEAVAHLMADIGKALSTRYGPEGSGTGTDFMPLVYNFKYHKGNAYHENLIEIMKAELDENRPMLYSAGSTLGREGHELVVDGYTSNDYFHYNYGWGGSYDGFYKATLIHEFSVGPSVVTGIYPEDTEIVKLNDFKYMLYKNGTATIIGYFPEGIDEDDDPMTHVEKENGEVVIPATVEHNGLSYKVIRICQRAFYNKGHFTKMTIGENIEAIDFYAFMYSTIDELVLSDKMEIVPDQAFQLTNIKKLTIGASVKRIGKKAFYQCPLTTVVCKSPAFEADDQAFSTPTGGTIDDGEWLAHITRLGREALAVRTFKNVPNFALLEEVGSRAFASCTFPEEEFVVPPKLKSIEPDAFWGAPLSFFKVENNPYFLCSPYSQEFLCNSNGTCLLMTVNSRRFGLNMPETVVRMEPRCIRNNLRIEIPAHIIDMEGAYKDVTSLSYLRCMATVPPEITDESFNDKIFDYDPTLYVPMGTAELYRNAPGWRRFNRIFDELEYAPMDAPGKQYFMVVNSTDEEQHRVNIPVNEVQSMEVSEDGKQVIIKRSGKEDLVTSVAAIDSIEWIPGFIFENAEVFDINQDNLTVEAQKCQIRFDPTVIDSDVQLCVRNSILKPHAMEGVVDGFAIDLSLSDGSHELTGTVDITIPVSDTSKKYGAAYYNEETGEWDPVYYELDKTAGTFTISTNHLSTYGIFEIANEVLSYATLTPAAIDFMERITPEPLNKMAGKLLEVVASDDPEWEMKWQATNDMGLWQSIGLDVLYSAANGTLEAGLGYKPFAEQIDNAVEAMGYLGTAMNVLSVARADLTGDQIGVASGTLKTILGHYGGVAGQFIGTTAFTASMATVAAIGIALDKFGTMVQEHKIDLYREAYEIYYSPIRSKAVVSGTSKYGNKWCYTLKDWFDIFYKAFSNPDKTNTQLDSYIEAVVRDYCDRFWNDTDAQAMCVAEAKAHGLSSMMYPDAYTRKTISDAYFAELMNGNLVSVIQSVRNHVKVDAFNRCAAEAKSLAKLMNTKIGLQILDKSVKEGEVSKYADHTIRFTYIPKSLSDPERLEKTITEQGRAKIGYFTQYALIVHDIPTRLTLIDPKGKEVADYPFTISNKKGTQVIEIDLSTGGVEVENPHLDGLELTYDPDSVVYLSDDRNHGAGVGYPITRIFLDNRNNKKARFETEIEKFFNRHEFVSVDPYGNIKIGDDIAGKFEDNGLEATGKFVIDTNYNFKEQTIYDCLKVLNSPGWFDELGDVFRPFSGTLNHKILCQYTITRPSVDSKEYEITYVGEGTYSLQAEVIEYIIGLIAPDNVEIVPALNISESDIHTTSINGEGKVQLKYSTTITP